MVELDIIIRGQHVQIRASEIYDWDEATLTDPDSNEVKIYDPAGTLLTTITTGFEQVGTGDWRLFYSVASDATPGKYRATWKAVKGAYTTREEAYFIVKS